MSDHLLDIIIQNSNERWDQMLAQDADYVRIEERMSKKFARLAKLKLTKKQNRAMEVLCFCLLIIRAHITYQKLSSNRGFLFEPVVLNLPNTVTL